MSNNQANGEMYLQGERIHYAEKTPNKTNTKKERL
jgi:hypothetical protein